MVEALLLSIKLALLTSTVLIVISLAIAYILCFTSIRGKTLIEAVILSPLLIPPTVLGFYLIKLFGNETLVGRLLEDVYGKSILFSFEGLLIGSLIYSLPLGVLPIKDSFSAINRRYIEIAYIFGYSKSETFRKVILPNSVNGMVTSFALVFAHTMGEFGVVLMIGGNIPGETQTLSIYIYDEVQSFNYASANLASLTLLGISITALLVMIWLRKK